jgi:hypothetical protein
MIPQRVAQRVSGFFLVAFPLLVLSGCTRPVAVSATRNKPAVINLPPNGSLQAFQQIERELAKYDWGPAHDAACQGCSGAGDVTIRYVGKTKDIKPSQGPAQLRIVALIQNYSNQDVVHTPSGTTFKAMTKYLMWVHSKNSKAVWGFIELGPGYDPNPKPIGQLYLCGHKPPSQYDDANFQECEDRYPVNSTGLVKTAYASTTMAAEIPKKAWVSCDPDCCTGLTTFAAE